MYCQLFVLLFCAKICFCANVLMVDSMPSPSHQIFNYGIVEKLLERGHNVTVLGPSSVRPIHDKNFHHLDLKDLYKVTYSEFDSEAVSSLNFLEMMQVFYDFYIFACDYSLQTPGFKALMNYPEDCKFDIILMELTNGECFLPLIQRFNFPPTIGITAFLLPPFLSFDFGNELQLAYTPSFYTTYSDDMTFFQRLKNYIVTYLDIYFRENYFSRELSKLLIKEFGNKMESLSNLENHISLLFANWNAALNYPQALTPNIIPIGGAHIKVKKLPKDIEEIMNSNSNGIVLFSLGTNVRSDSLSEEKRKLFMNAFSKLKQTVLWKFESNITGLPNNVIIRKWLPQTDLLAHPNLKLFISHGGGLSTIEASHFGVPVLGIPFFIDQLLNIQNLVTKQVARQIDHTTLTGELFLENIHEMLNNDKYTNNMKELSRRIRDQPETPLDRAAFWIEYSIRHNGTHFLNTKSRTLPLYISSSADIHLFIFTVFCIVLYLLKTIFNFGKSIIKRNVKNASKSKKNK